jgi:type I restriction enzyme M protein
MNNEQIKQLEKELWDSADNLRANSKLTDLV